MLRQDERGITLVEIVISMGMFSIVMISIMLFMTSGSKSYGIAKSELNLQTESQMFLNQVRDIAYQTNYVEYDATHKALIMCKLSRKTATPAPTSSSVPPTASPSASDLYNVDTIQVVYPLNGKLYLEELTGDSFSSIKYSGLESDDAYLMCDYVTDFDVVLKGKNIKLDVTMKNGTAGEYSFTEDITLRNKLIKYTH